LKSYTETLNTGCRNLFDGCNILLAVINAFKTLDLIMSYEYRVMSTKYWI